jgi:hypothetical protein
VPANVRDNPRHRDSTVSKLFRQLDDDSLRATDVAELVAVLVALHLADQLGASGSQAGDDGVDIVNGE